MPGSQAPPQEPQLRRIIKLGGAAITVKPQLETLQPATLQAVCSSIATPSPSSAAHAVASGAASAALRAPPSPPPYVSSETASSAVASSSGPSQAADTVIVHGAGSFGHHQASQYGVAKGPLPQAARGFALTR